MGSGDHQGTITEKDRAILGGCFDPWRFHLPKMMNRAQTCLPAAFVLLILLLLVMVQCGGGGGGGGGSNSGSISLQLANGTVTVPAGGSIGRVGVTIGRTGSTGSVTLNVSGVPTGASATFVQPANANAGEVDLNPGTAAMGTYALSVTASDGVISTNANLSLVINSGITSQLPGPFAWSSTAPLISAIPDASHPIVAVKDPSVVFFNNLWHVYATTSTGSAWSMQYINFSTWQQAASAMPYYMDQTAGFSGYHAAPEVFFFRPQNKWYLIFQSGPPTYSTNADLSQPGNWTAPQNFFASQPANISGWLGFWVICDSANCYLFFSDDNGGFYRCQTTIQNFPNGFSAPVLVMQAANAFDLFEASCTYYLQGLNQYLTIIAIDGSGRGIFGLSWPTN